MHRLVGMVIKSFVRSDFGLRPVDVEVVLVPGLSTVEILGMPDSLIKESSKRIQSALRHQGFRIPGGKKVLVNLHPNHIKKTSLGLDLAIAIGALVESGQLDKELFDFGQDYIYGGLSLKGEVTVPEDLYLLNYENFEKRVVTGKDSLRWRFAMAQVETLSEVSEMVLLEPHPEVFQCESHPVNSALRFNDSMARLMVITAVGEHPMLIAGFAGCGKTTLVENLAHIINLPDENTFLQAKKLWLLAGRSLHTRPVVQPHHSTTPLAMIGGGASLRFGEISLAHGGALILDELLEFHPQVQSALREPMEKGCIYISRAGGRKQFPADALILGTTNLCPCGSFEPGKAYQCRCSSLRLRQYIERLTGPFLDRFAIFHIFQKPKTTITTSLSEIRDQVIRATEFRLEKRQQTVINQKLPLDILMEELDKNICDELIPVSQSHRRRLALLRVARTIADLDSSERIKSIHLDEAQRWTASDIYKLERFRMEDFAVR